MCTYTGIDAVHVHSCNCKQVYECFRVLCVVYCNPYTLLIYTIYIEIAIDIHSSSLSLTFSLTLCLCLSVSRYLSPFLSPPPLSLSVAIINLNDISERSQKIAVSDERIATVAAGLNAILWIALVIFPFIQVTYFHSQYQFYCISLDTMS